MPRGPKTRTALNAGKGRAKVIRHETLEPPCPLAKDARKEYDRLVGVLRAKGTIDRVDLGVIAECARLAGVLGRYHAAIDLSEGIPEKEHVAYLGVLTNQRRGLLRELGLTSQPSRSVVRANPVPAQDADADPIASRIKLA